MEVEIRNRPSFANLLVKLKPGDRIIGEGDAMASMDTNVAFDTKMMGGFFKALIRRVAGGESLFVNEFYLEKGQEGELVLTQNVPGDLVEMEIPRDGIYLQPSAFMACTGDVSLKTSWAGFKSWFAGEGLFRLLVTGHGKVWFGAFGGVMKKEVQGEYLVDTSHLVAYEPSLKMKIQLAGEGAFSSFFSGEGFVTRLEGNGIAYIQTRTIQGLASWINPRLV
ncbi:MAG: TIGR00266 family protein [Planctomycetota bacterium]|nr:MAG: TIGR00266 family protein [Planctomycetota bacterium]